MMHTAKYMHQILNLSLDAYDEIFQEIDTTNLVDRKGIIYVWTNQNLKSRELEIKIRNDLGVKQKILSTKEILDLEPNLRPVFTGGAYYDYAYHARDPYGILKKIFELFIKRGGKFIKERVENVNQPSNNETIIKTDNKGGRGDFKDTDFELKQLVSESLVAEGVTDIFKIAGLETPDISILSEEFLKEVQKMPHKNLAVELLNKLINDQVKSKFRTNVVKQRKFSDLLQNALSKYQNRSIEAAQVIAELIEMAKEFKKEMERKA